MPGRAILNNCVNFVINIRKLSTKRSVAESETDLITRAAIIAALSSNHSWKTYKYLNNLCEIDKEGICAETEYAFREGWKSISESDVEEVINSNLNSQQLSLWMYYAVSREKRQKLIEVFEKMRKEMAYNLEPLQKVKE